MTQTLTPQGLSHDEAARRFRAEGANELPSSRHRSVLAIALGLLREPMLLLLVACGAIYLVLGDLHEALLLIGSIAVIIGIELYQEHKTERALEALRDLSSPRALVIRNGERLRIAGREVVRGDLMVLAEGDRVPADAVVRAGEHLLLDESLLTGESAPVTKIPDATAQQLGRPGGEGHASVFAGTLVVSGQGLAEVLAIGLRTEMGKIGKSLQEVETEATHVQVETARLVRIFATIGAILCVLAAVVYTMTRGDWLQGVLAGLTLAISMVPEELPVVLTVFLALGAWRLSRQQVLARRVAAVEMLGAATVLCTDKTGTLTINRMTVQHLVTAQGGGQELSPDAPLPPAAQELAGISILASRPESFDPSEQALQALAPKLPAQALRAGWTLIHTYPITRERLAMAQAWRSPDGAQHLVAAKGAPEAIASLCRLTGSDAARLTKATEAMAVERLRIFGVAAATVTASQVEAPLEQLPFSWQGLIGLADPLRPTAAQAVRECREAGVRVIMVTGDYPVTAQGIAKQIGLEGHEEVLTGAELDAMDDATLAERIRTVNCFARIVPEQKLRLVQALKTDGEVVAMTGDGVNDAPALKAAHIGVAMGARGTDVAREAADLVLVDDDFSSIVRAIRVGRRIFDNLKKAMAYILAVHVPIAGIALIPLVLKLPLVLYPVHIVFLELIIDPACSIAFEAEPEEADVMRRRPRPSGSRLITGRAALLSVLQGASVLLLVLGVYAVTLWQGKGEAEARAMTVTSLIIANVALIFTNRSWSRTILETLRAPNPALWGIVTGAFGVLALVLYVPPVRNLFRFGPLHLHDLAICAMAGFAGIVWFELLKWSTAHLRRSRSTGGVGGP